MAPLLEQVERWLERVFEAPGRRLFRPRLQPVELSRAVGRAMEANSLVGAGGLIVPNTYRVLLHPADFDALASWRPTLERDLAGFVQQRAQARGWTCSGQPRVQ